MQSPARSVPTRFIIAGLTGALLLAGCGKGEDAAKAKAKAEGDPAVSGALGDQIMVDPELAGQQGGGASGKIELPPEQRTPEAIAAAKAEAAKLVGGALQSAPAPGAAGDLVALEQNAATAAQVAAAAKTGNVDCAGKVQYSANWVTSLPGALAVYPKGAVQDAAGTDADGCRLRVVSFVTPVATGDVIDFYYTRLRAEGYEAKHQRNGNDSVLGGGKGSAAYVIYARKLENGLTEVDLVASGG